MQPRQQVDVVAKPAGELLAWGSNQLRVRGLTTGAMSASFT
jgi:hypothetical protein